jgi:cytoskeleton protein RodZ
MAENEIEEVELPLDTAGVVLNRAREAAGKSLAQLAAQTKISERQLAAIEAGDYAALPSRTYAVGFTRTYAKALGLDPNAVLAMVRSELAEREPEQRRTVPSFEPGDPARLPGRRTGWIAAAGLAAVVAVVLIAWPGLYSPGGTLPSILMEETPSPAATAAAPAAPAPAGPVVFTATRDQVWVRVIDGTGAQIMQKVLALGESWTVPPGVPGVALTTARPDGLAVTIGGRAVPPLADSERLVSNVPVTAEALLARGTAEAQTASAPAVTAVNAPDRQPRPAQDQRSTGVAPTSPEPAPATAPSEPAAAPTAGTTQAAAADS